MPSHRGPTARSRSHSTLVADRPRIRFPTPPSETGEYTERARPGGRRGIRACLRPFGVVTSMRVLRCAATVFGLVLAFAAPTRAQTSFLEFESGPVRPLALTPDGTKLLVCNIPDNRLEIFSVSAGGLAHQASVPVGMEPVAVAARSNTEAWVVNHLSDSVSVVDLASSPPRVVRTLLVGDEPQDIVFAGTGGNRAFVTTARRGQQRSNSSLIGSTPGAG